MALKFDWVTTPPEVVASPTQVVNFPNGETLELLCTSLGERLILDHPAKGIFKYFVRQTGGSLHSSGGNSKSLMVERKMEDGRDVSFRTYSDSPGGMLLEIRLKSSNGMPMKLPFYMVERDFILDDQRLTGTQSAIAKLATQSDSVVHLAEAMTKTGLQLLIQQRDPLSGWIDLTGPFLFNESWTDRYVMILTAWQRSLASLDFRAILADGQVAEFSLPNPDFRKAPAPASVKTLPFVHTAHDYSLTLRKVERFSTPGDHPFTAVEMDLVYTGTPVRGIKNGPVTLNNQGVHAKDEWGNASKVQSESIGKKYRWGTSLPAESKRMTFNIQVARTEHYPRNARDGFTVLEGVVSADGTKVDFKPGPDAALFGISKMPACSIKSASSGWDGKETKDWKELRLEIGGENDAKAMDVIRKKVGDQPMQWTLPIFSGESDESIGIAGPGLGGGGGGGVNCDFNFTKGFQWLVPPELLVPGAKIRMGIHSKLKHDDLSFDLELPELVQPR